MVEESTSKEKPEKTQLEDNVVYVGNKSVMNYVLAVVTLFNKGINPIEIKARGKAISRAVDVAEIVKHRFLSDVKVDDIKIGTEEIESEGKKLNVSTIEIRLAK